MSRPGERTDVPQIDVVTACHRASENASYLLDVREPDELVEFSVPGAIHIPLGSLSSRVSDLPRDGELLVICHSGVRSAYATQFLLASGFDGTKNIGGGVIAWAQAHLPYTSFGQPFNQAERTGCHE